MIQAMPLPGFFDCMLASGFTSRCEKCCKCCRCTWVKLFSGGIGWRTQKLYNWVGREHQGNSCQLLCACLGLFLFLAGAGETSLNSHLNVSEISWNSYPNVKNIPEFLVFQRTGDCNPAQIKRNEKFECVDTWDCGFESESWNMYSTHTAKFRNTQHHTPNTSPVYQFFSSSQETVEDKRQISTSSLVLYGCIFCPINS